MLFSSIGVNRREKDVTKFRGSSFLSHFVERSVFFPIWWHCYDNICHVQREVWAHRFFFESVEDVCGSLWHFVEFRGAARAASETGVSLCSEAAVTLRPIFYYIQYVLIIFDIFDFFTYDNVFIFSYFWLISYFRDNMSLFFGCHIVPACNWSRCEKTCRLHRVLIW